MSKDSNNKLISTFSPSFLVSSALYLAHTHKFKMCTFSLDDAIQTQK